MMTEGKTTAKIQSSLIARQRNLTKNQTDEISIHQTIHIPSSRMFGYPTRLMCAWESRIMQIDLPERTQPAPWIKVGVCQDSTQSLGIQPNRFYKRLFKKLISSLYRGNQYLYDGRYDTDGNIAHLLGCIIDKILIARSALPECGPTLILRSNAITMAKSICKILGIPLICTDRFKKFYYEDIPIHQQWSISRNADVIVAIHGAALSSLLSNRKRAKVLAVVPSGLCS